MPVRGMNMDVFHKHNVKKKKPYMKSYDSIYIKFKINAKLT